MKKAMENSPSAAAETQSTQSFFRQRDKIKERDVHELRELD
jgi:hypothetical protein